MKNLILSFISLLCTTGAVAQIYDVVGETQTVLLSESNGEQDSLYTFLYDEQPQFPGGIDELMKYLNRTLRYPEEAQQAEIQGKVVVKIGILKDGSIGEATISKSVHPILDAEAIRVVQSMPNWIPGKRNGKPVGAWFNLPITFKLFDDVTATHTLSESDQSDYENFIRLGEEALSAGNTNHAYLYFKECFNMKPWDFSLIDRIDSMLSNQTGTREQFYDWAVKRLYREMEAGHNYEGLIPHMVSLQERLVESHPNDLYTLCIMQEIYFDTHDFDKIILISDKIYPLIPTDQIDTLASVLTIHTYALSQKGNNEEVIKLIVTYLDKLLTQPEESANTLPLLTLLSAYYQQNDKEGAKLLLAKLKQAYPSFYTKYTDYILQHDSEYKSFVEEALK